MEILHLLVVELVKHFVWDILMLTCDDCVPGGLKLFDIVSFSLDTLKLHKPVHALTSGTSIAILVD